MKKGWKKRLSILLVFAFTLVNTVPAFASVNDSTNIIVIPYKGINIVVTEFVDKDCGITEGYDIATDSKDVPGAYQILVEYAKELKKQDDKIAQDALANEPSLNDYYDQTPVSFYLNSGDPAYNTQAIESSKLTWKMRSDPHDAYIMLTGARILYGYNNNPENPRIEMWESLDFSVKSVNSFTISWPPGFGASPITTSYQSPKTALVYGNIAKHNFGAETIKLSANSSLAFTLGATYRGSAYCHFGTYEGRTTSDWNTIGVTG